LLFIFLLYSFSTTYSTAKLELIIQAFITWYLKGIFIYLPGLPLRYQALITR
jgi:hypothetical protein